MNGPFEQDCLEILSAKAARGEISRRRFTQFAAMFAASAPLALPVGSASAAANQLVLVNWGGDALKAYNDTSATVRYYYRKELDSTQRAYAIGPWEAMLDRSGQPEAKP